MRRSIDTAEPGWSRRRQYDDGLDKWLKRVAINEIISKVYKPEISTKMR